MTGILGAGYIQVIHPGKSNGGRNLKITCLRRKIIWTKPQFFAGSMLNFSGFFSQKSGVIIWDPKIGGYQTMQKCHGKFWGISLIIVHEVWVAVMGSTVKQVRSRLLSTQNPRFPLVFSIDFSPTSKSPGETTPPYGPPNHFSGMSPRFPLVLAFFNGRLVGQQVQWSGSRRARLPRRCVGCSQGN